MSTILHCVQAGAFTVGCAAIHGQRARPDVVTGVLLAAILALFVAVAAVASPPELVSARFASATDPTFLMFAE
jgi:hypothetical protein